MKLLTLLRHAKSVQDPAFTDDRERPLADRGRGDAALMGKYFAQAELVPDLIVSSPVVRTRETAELFAKGAGYGKPVRWEEVIYLADGDGLLAVVQGLPDDAGHVLLIGHNPGFEELAELLIGAESAAGGVSLPTAAAAHIQFEVDNWASVQTSAGQLQWLVTPKLVKKMMG